MHEPLIDEDPVFITTCTERELRKRKKRKFSLWVRQCSSTGFICQVSQIYTGTAIMHFLNYNMHKMIILKYIYSFTFFINTAGQPLTFISCLCFKIKSIKKIKMAGVKGIVRLCLDILSRTQYHKQCKECMHCG